MKLSIGFFLLRVATVRLHIWIIHIVMSSAALFGTAFTFIALFQCWPIWSFWTLYRDGGHCMSWTVVSGQTYAGSALIIVADWTFAILPIFIVKELTLSKKQKMLVAGLLAFAAVASTATIIRLPYVHTMSQSYLGLDGDFLCKYLQMVLPNVADLWLDDTVELAIWTTVEVGVGITAGCIATLRPLLQLILSKAGRRPGSRSRTPQHLSFRNIPGRDLQLGGLKPHHGTTTTITGNDNTGINHSHTRDTSRENLDPSSSYISKQVRVESGEAY